MAGVGLLSFLLIGLLAGYIAEKVMKADHGLLTNLIVGVVGAYLGGFLARALGLDAYGFIANLVVASVGAVLLLYILRIIKGR